MKKYFCDICEAPLNTYVYSIKSSWRDVSDDARYEDDDYDDEPVRENSLLKCDDLCCNCNDKLLQKISGIMGDLKKQAKNGQPPPTFPNWKEVPPIGEQNAS